MPGISSFWFMQWMMIMGADLQCPAGQNGWEEDVMHRCIAGSEANGIDLAALRWLQLCSSHESIDRLYYLGIHGWIPIW